MNPLTRFLLLCALSGASATVVAQTPATGNLVINGDFAKSTPEDNLWDGVNSAGALAGWTANIYAATEAGRAGGLPMPISVNLADVNGDKLPDLVAADPSGYLRAYINSGTATEPKFTHAEMVPLYLPRIARDTMQERGVWIGPFGAPKISLHDWSRRGTLDLLVGNYVGDILLVPNTGSSLAPAYAQPQSYGKVKVETSTKRPWGNLFAPCSVDWNKDGKMDLLVGEGSYSANAVYVLLNQSGSNAPKFTEEQRFYLCYGDGREQLVPTVADYNGDGLTDVLVGDRLGTVGVFLNQGSWKPGTELPLATNIPFGASDKIGAPNATAIAPSAGDYNGDGLFDLVIGRADGRISVAVNKGTKTEPKFETPVEIKGKDLFSEKIFQPTNFTMDPGKNRGNLYGYISVLQGEASPGGGKILKAGYFPSPNKAFKIVPVSVEGRSDDSRFFVVDRYEWEAVPAGWDGWSRSSDCFIIRQQLPSLKVGGTYELSFKAKGVGMVDGSCTVAYLGAAETTGRKVVRGERGSVKIDRGEVHEEIRVTEPISANGAWKNYEKTFTVTFTKEKEIKALEQTTLAVLEFKATLPQYATDFQICDVQLVAKPR